MLMETLISRGGYPVRYRINGFEYVFRRNDDGHFVCPVLSGDHRKLLIGTGNFRVYAPKEPEVEQHDSPMIATRPRIEPSFMPKCVASSAVLMTLADASNRPSRKAGMVVTEKFEAVKAFVEHANGCFTSAISAMNHDPAQSQLVSVTVTEAVEPKRRGGRRRK